MFISNQNPFEFVLPTNFSFKRLPHAVGKFPMRQTRALSRLHPAKTLESSL